MLYLPRFLVLSTAGYIFCTQLVWGLDQNFDGMDDLWQQRYGIAAFTGALDPDNDGRPNVVESMNWSDPGSAADGVTGWGLVSILDANNDKLEDDWAAQYQITNPLADPDGDGRLNIEESLTGSHPMQVDTPFSLAPLQVTGGVSGTNFLVKFRSLPTLRYETEVSTDLLTWTSHSFLWGDASQKIVTVPFAAAARRFHRTKLVRTSTEAILDTDGDQLLDWYEVNIFTSDPNLHDSDGDSYSDGIEASLGLDPIVVNSPTSDGDGDGLTLAQEIAMGSNPTVAATLDTSNALGLTVYTPGL